MTHSRRWLTRAALGAAFLLAACATPTSEPVAESDDCLTPAEAVGHYEALFEEARVLDVMTGPTAQRFLEILNAVPPLSHYEADEIVVFGRDERHVVMETPREAVEAFGQCAEAWQGCREEALKWRARQDEIDAIGE